MTLKQLRLNNGLTQSELAERLNVDQTCISKWETGSATPPVKTITEIAKVLIVPVEEVVKCFTEESSTAK